MFKKVLIANRGEIALRIIRTCKEMGIYTIAVFSEADKYSSHIAFADESICIGPPPSHKSYLDSFVILDAAVISDVDAIHPGYGFLAENHTFAEMCKECNIAFIGPRPESIQLMGNKSEARKMMKRAGIPVIPGSEGDVNSIEQAIKIADDVGYPVIIKASAGGGGRGMRIAADNSELKKIFPLARSETAAVFGNPALYIEKYIEEPRHIEFQILADDNGTIVHLGERDCTIQRRHQKLIEESPSLALDEKLRKEMGEVAVKVAASVGYVNAGTVEFLLDKHKNFYFMEMNTRIQVEHPVTEMITGIDLVKEQIRIACGEKLGFNQRSVEFNGHALECRINAEDPEKDFLPSAGIIHDLFIPGGMGVRVDTHIYPGCEISQYYDSMVGKLIISGKDRNEVIRKAMGSLDEFLISGVTTTVGFLKKILAHKDFIKGDYSTHFLEKFKL